MTKSYKEVILLSIIFLLSSGTFVFSSELDRNVAFTENKFLQIDPSASVFKDLSSDIRPSIVLKGASVEEEKEMLSAFFNLGYNLRLIYYVYVNYPLDYEIDNVSAQKVIASNLRELRDLLAELEAEDRLIELVNEIRMRILKENTTSKKANPQISTLFQTLMFNEIQKHIEDTFGLSYTTYYAFGIWTNSVLTTCEERIIYDELIQKLSPKERAKINKGYTEQLKTLLESSQNYKSGVKELVNKAVSRNLDKLYEIASEIKGSVDKQTAKRAYDYGLNVYYALLPSK